jgi:hypothetical protein
MRRPLILIAILAAMLPIAAPAAASTTDRIIQDCQHSPTGELSGTYTRKELRRALHNLPGDVLEYSGCHDAIEQALLDASIRPPGDGGDGGGGGGGPAGGSGAGGGLPPTAGGGATAGGSIAAPGSDGAATPPHSGSKAPVAVDGGLVEPGRIPTIGRDAHALPASLIVLLATTLGRRVLARRRA